MNVDFLRVQHTRASCLLVRSVSGGDSGRREPSQVAELYRFLLLDLQLLLVAALAFVVLKQKFVFETFELLPVYTAPYNAASQTAGAAVSRELLVRNHTQQ